MSPKKTVKIDAFPESAFRYLGYDAIVCVDVIRATTTAVTAVAQDRRVFPVASVEDAFTVAGRLEILVDPFEGLRVRGNVADLPTLAVNTEVGHASAELKVSNLETTELLSP